MKPIYLVLCAMMAVVLFTIIIYSDYRNIVATVHSVHETTSTPCQSDTCSNPRYINYSKFQPGLLEIADQMVKEYVNKRVTGDDAILEVYPILLDFTMIDDSQSAITVDTFKYNWKNDIILCINSIDFANEHNKCELISSQDTVKAMWNFPRLELDRNIRTELKDNHKYLDAVKDWDKTILDSICISDELPSTTSSYYYFISRLIIKNGGLVDARYIRCDYIDTSKIK